MIWITAPLKTNTPYGLNKRQVHFHFPGLTCRFFVIEFTLNFLHNITFSHLPPNTLFSQMLKSSIENQVFVVTSVFILLRNMELRWWSIKFKSVDIFTISSLEVGLGEIQSYSRRCKAMTMSFLSKYAYEVPSSFAGPWELHLLYFT